ncbi:MAG: hypothetical protein WC246_02760 [Candidatus Paceibacterota bacterium]|jgi:hypothetical protein
MSYFNVCVFVDRDESDFEQMAQRASETIANFDINKNVEPYRYYVTADQISRMAQWYGVDATNIPVLAEKLEEWDGDKGGVDEIGLYGISVKNPVGHTDHWSAPEQIKFEDRERCILSQGEGGKERIIKAVVTPDGEWIDGPWVYGVSNVEQDEELEAWNKKRAALFVEYKNATAFLLECHV